MQYWLMKSEPDEFSFQDLYRRPGRREPWDGVRTMSCWPLCPAPIAYRCGFWGSGNWGQCSNGGVKSRSKPPPRRVPLRATGGRSRALLISSGNANALTGTRGVADARRIALSVAAATGIRESGWDWDSYEPLVGLALEYGMPVGAGNAPREQVNQVAMGGLKTIPAHRQDALGISSPLPAPGLAALSETSPAVRGDARWVLAQALD